MLIANIKLALAEEEALERKQKLQEDRDRLARKKAQVCPSIIINIVFSTTTHTPLTHSLWHTLSYP